MCQTSSLLLPMKTENVVGMFELNVGCHFDRRPLTDCLIFAPSSLLVDVNIDLLNSDSNVVDPVRVAVVVVLLI